MYAIGYVLGFYRSVNVELMEELRLGRFFIKTPLTEVERGYLTTGGGYGQKLNDRLLGAESRCRIRTERFDSDSRQGLVRFCRRVDK